MSKIKLDNLTEKELQEKQSELENDIDTLNKIIEASNSTVFDLLIKEVKEEMKSNIGEESWKKLKENMKKIEQYRSIETTLQNQQDLLERKEDELEDVKYALKYHQTNLFENLTEENSEQQAIDTNYTFGTTLQPIETGDIFVNKNSNPETYYFIQRAKNGKDFAIIGNSVEEELLLNYPKNRELIDSAEYIGNIYYGGVDKQEALEAYEKMKKFANS